MDAFAGEEKDFSSKGRALSGRGHHPLKLAGIGRAVGEQRDMPLLAIRLDGVWPKDVESCLGRAQKKDIPCEAGGIRKDRGGNSDGDLRLPVVHKREERVR